MDEIIKSILNNSIKYYELNKDEIFRVSLAAEEEGLRKRATLKCFYNDENFIKQINQEKNELRLKKYSVAAVYLCGIETKKSLAMKGFTTVDLRGYVEEFKNDVQQYLYDDEKKLLK